jgi:sugar phosphate permease
VPIAWLALTSLGQRKPEALAIFAVLAISCVLGFTKAETERIWLFLAPLVILCAAPLVRRPQLLIGVLAVQAVVYELLFDTLW